MKYLGIDHGTKSAWSIREDDKYICSGKVKFPEGSKDVTFKEYYNFMYQLIFREKPDVVCMEEAKHLTNAKTTRFLTGLYTINKLLCLRMGIQYLEISPVKMKKDLTGSGRAEKDLVFSCLVNDFNIPLFDIFEPEYYKKEPNKIKNIDFDKSDATALALYGYRKVNNLYEDRKDGTSKKRNKGTKKRAARRNDTEQYKFDGVI